MPSAAVASSADTCGSGVASVIVPVASSTKAPFAPTSLTANVSSASTTVSSSARTDTVFDVSPAANSSTPLAAW